MMALLVNQIKQLTFKFKVLLSPVFSNDGVEPLTFREFVSLVGVWKEHPPIAIYYLDKHSSKGIEEYLTACGSVYTCKKAYLYITNRNRMYLNRTFKLKNYNITWTSYEIIYPE